MQQGGGGVRTIFDYMPKHSKHSKFQLHSKCPSIHYYYQITNDLFTVSSIRFEKKGNGTSPSKYISYVQNLLGVS
jgi:hypothetical protein